MNIFFVDLDPSVCARRLMDSHIRKMTLESLQLLYTHLAVRAGKILFSNAYPIEMMNERIVPDNRELIRVGDNLLNLRQQKIRYFKLVNSSRKRIFYKKTHVDHACRRWLSLSAINVIWLLAHFEALCEEFERRFDKKHACEAHLENLFGLLHKFADYFTETPWLLNGIGDVREDNLTSKVIQALNAHKFDMAPRKASRIYGSLIGEGASIRTIPLVVGSTLLRVLAETRLRGIPGLQVPMVDNLSLAINAYRTIYLDKLPRLKGNTFTKDTFGIQAGWDAEKTRLVDQGKHIYVVSTTGMLLNTLYNRDIPNDCVVVLKESHAPKNPLVIDAVYPTIRTYLVGQEGVLDFMRILKGEPEVKTNITPGIPAGPTPPWVTDALTTRFNGHVHENRNEITTRTFTALNEMTPPAFLRDHDPVPMERIEIQRRPTDLELNRAFDFPRVNVAAYRPDPELLHITGRVRVTTQDAVDTQAATTRPIEDHLAEITTQANLLDTFRMGTATVTTRRADVPEVFIDLPGQPPADPIRVEVDDTNFLGTAIKVHFRVVNITQPINRDALSRRVRDRLMPMDATPIITNIHLQEEPDTWRTAGPSYFVTVTIDVSEWNPTTAITRGVPLVSSTYAEVSTAIDMLLRSANLTAADIDRAYTVRYNLLKTRIREALILLRERYVAYHTHTNLPF